MLYLVLFLGKLKRTQSETKIRVKGMYIHINIHYLYLKIIKVIIDLYLIDLYLSSLEFFSNSS